MLEAFIFAVIISFNIWIYYRYIFNENQILSIILSMALSVLSTGIAANMLSLIGVFSVRNVGICILLFSVLIIFVKRNKKKLHEKCSSQEWILFSVLIIITMQYLMYKVIPFGIGRDPSVYLLEAINISNYGSIRLPIDTYINQNYEFLNDIIDLGYTGIYSVYDLNLSELPGENIVQFLHFFPSLLAIGYQIYGINGIFILNGIIAGVSVLTFYCLVKKYIVSDNVLAVFTAIILAISPEQLYSARITQTECLAQLSVLFSFYCIIKGKREKSLKFSFLAVLGMFTMMINRIDMYMVGFAISIGAAYEIIVGKNNRQTFIVTLGYYIDMALCLAYSYIFSTPYFLDHWKANVLKYLVLCNILLALIVAVIYILRNTIIVKSVNKILERITSKQTLLYKVTAIGILSLFVFLYFIRPMFGIGKSNAVAFRTNAIVEFCFYIPFIAVLFSVIGLIYFIKNKIEENEISDFMIYLMTGGMCMLIYFYSPSIAPDHIWAGRRWLPIITPFIVSFVFYGVQECLRRLNTTVNKRCIHILLFIAVSMFIIKQDNVFMYRNLNADILDQYEDIAEDISDENIYLCKDKLAVTILRIMYGKDNVYKLGSTANLKKIYNAGENIQENIMLIGEYNDAELVSRHTVINEELERAIGEFPRDVIGTEKVYNIYQLK